MEEDRSYEASQHADMLELERRESVRLTVGGKLAAALVKAQGEFERAVKDSTNPHLNSRYADMASVVAAIRPALARNELAFVQVVHDRPRAAAVETIIIHASGEHLSTGVLSVPVAKADAQGFGSAMTYARRYSLSATFGVAPDDDDGHAASAAPASARPAKPAAYPAQQFSANFPAWEAAIKSGKITADALIAMVSIKGALSVEQMARLRNVTVTYADKLSQRLASATEMDVLSADADLIRNIDDEAERARLTAIYTARRAELEA